MFKYLPLLRCAVGGFECAARIALPAARKVTAIIRIIGPGHGYLITVVDAGRSAKRQEERECEFNAVSRSGLLVHEARNIVVSKKSHQSARIWVKAIFGQRLRDRIY